MLTASLLETSVLCAAAPIVDDRDVAVVEVDDLAMRQVRALAVTISHGTWLSVEVEGGITVGLG